MTATNLSHFGKADTPQCALFLARRTARVLTQLYDSHLSECGILSAQFALLMLLDRAPGRTQTELGRMLGMDKTTLSRNLSVLLRKGWIAVASAKDSRQRRIALTSDGARQLALATPAWKRAQASLRGGMKPGEWDAMWMTMQATANAAAQAMDRTK